MRARTHDILVSTLVALTAFVAASACRGPIEGPRTLDRDLLAAGPGAHRLEPIGARPFWDACASEEDARTRRAPTVRERLRQPANLESGFASFDVLLGALRERTGLPLVATHAACRIATVEQVGAAVRTSDDSPALLLERLTAAEPCLSWRYADGIVLVEATAERRDRTRLVYYDVSDVLGTEDATTLMGRLLEETDAATWTDEPEESVRCVGAGTLAVRAPERIHRVVRAILGS